MKYEDNMISVADMGPDFMGFIFYDESSRYFNKCIPDLPLGVKKVGVFDEYGFVSGKYYSSIWLQKRLN